LSPEIELIELCSIPTLSVLKRAFGIGVLCVILTYVAQVMPKLLLRTRYCLNELSTVGPKNFRSIGSQDLTIEIRKILN